MSMFFGNRILRAQHILRAPEGEGEGGGKGGKEGEGAPDTAKLMSELSAQNKALMERLEKLEKSGGPKGGKEGDGDDDLASKAAKQREIQEKQTADSKSLEAALKFALGAPDWLKTNASLLPKTVEGIFQAADKEVYSNSVEKANAIKVGIVSEFFAQQANLDLLTESQKNALEEFRKLTKTVKQERVAQVYDSIFEPTFEMLKRIKKAEAVSKGHSSPNDAQAAHKEKMIAASRKHYLREKK